MKIGFGRENFWSFCLKLCLCPVPSHPGSSPGARAHPRVEGSSHLRRQRSDSAGRRTGAERRRGPGQPRLLLLHPGGRASGQRCGTQTGTGHPDQGWISDIRSCGSPSEGLWLPVARRRNTRGVTRDGGRWQTGGAVNIAGAVTSVRVPTSHLGNKEF